jgi:hypothetical protein
LGAQKETATFLGVLIGKGSVVLRDHDCGTHERIPIRIAGEVGESMPSSVFGTLNLDSGADVEDAWRNVR